jgi:hypothetical protein
MTSPRSGFNDARLARMTRHAGTAGVIRSASEVMRRRRGHLSFVIAGSAFELAILIIFEFEIYI